jgi:hypothetical protein
MLATGMMSLWLPPTFFRVRGCAWMFPFCATHIASFSDARSGAPVFGSAGARGKAAHASQPQTLEAAVPPSS